MQLWSFGYSTNYLSLKHQEKINVANTSKPSTEAYWDKMQGITIANKKHRPFLKHGRLKANGDTSELMKALATVYNLRQTISLLYIMSWQLCSHLTSPMRTYKKQAHTRGGLYITAG
jgi:hypothetical protein